jgi:hypothetical protein
MCLFNTMYIVLFYVSSLPLGIAYAEGVSVGKYGIVLI